MSEKTIPTQLTIIELIWELLKKLIKYGNRPVYYFIPGGMVLDDNKIDPYFPLEVEEVIIRKDSCNNDLIMIK